MNSDDRTMGMLAPLIACLTLGLAPFLPEPHIVGKVRWLVGGAHGMAPLDWFDLVLHGSPWLWALCALTLKWRRRKSTK